MDKNAFKKKGNNTEEEVKQNEIKNTLNNWYLGEEDTNKEEPQLDDPRIIRQGYLKTTMPEEGDKPCKLSQKWFCLTEGSLYLYKDQHGEKHSNWLKLRGGKISLSEKDGKHMFDIESGEKTFSFHSDDDDDQNRWVMYLKAELNSNPSQPPKRLIAKKKSKMFSASKNLYEKAALTQPGKKLIMNFAPEEMVDVLEKLSNLFQKVSKKGDEHYSNALRVIMKSLLLIKGKEASIEDFKSCRIPGLKAWHSFIEMENSKNKKKDIESLSKEFKELHLSVSKVLQPHLTPKSIVHRVNAVFELIEQEDVLEKIFSDDKDIVECRTEMCKSLRHVWENKISKNTQKKISNSKLIEN